jgi:hypothetical protein
LKPLALVSCVHNSNEGLLFIWPEAAEEIALGQRGKRPRPVKLGDHLVEAAPGLIAIGDKEGQLFLILGIDHDRNLTRPSVLLDGQEEPFLDLFVCRPRLGAEHDLLAIPFPIQAGEPDDPALFISR